MRFSSNSRKITTSINPGTSSQCCVLSNVFNNIFSHIPGGFTCADTLRQNGFRGRIILFTSEGTLPYDRVSYFLSKYQEKEVDNYSGSIIETTIEKTSRFTYS
jgi:hypothetical protein